MKKNKILSGKWILSNGKIYDPYKNKFLNGDILLSNGKIESIGKIKDKNAKFINCKGKIITSGFIDGRCYLRLPGSGYTETIDSGVSAAMAGGYTSVCLMPEESSPLDNPEIIQYVLDSFNERPINIFPIGSISVGHKGSEIAEFGKMSNKGCIAFSDSFNCVENSQFLRYVYQYSQMYKKRIINHPQDRTMNPQGILNEGFLSTKLGLEGIPNSSESAIVFRDLAIAHEVGAKIHIPHISAKESISIIKEFKKKGLDVTCEVTPHHIFLNESEISEYNTNAKVCPPLRSEKDRVEIIKAIKSGIISCISTDHSPCSSEDKERDIKHAPFGTIGLESAFSATFTGLSEYGFKIEDVIKLFTLGPKEVFNLDVDLIKTGSKANLTIIDPKERWTFSESDIHSKSNNSIMLGKELLSKIIFTVSGKHAFGYF